MKRITITQDEVKTQRDEILLHLKLYGSITSWTAIQDYGATRLSAIIYDFRNQGYQIDSIEIPWKTRLGKTTKITEYTYIEPRRKMTPKQSAIWNSTFSHSKNLS